MVVIRMFERFGGKATLVDYSPAAKVFLMPLKRITLRDRLIANDLFFHLVMKRMGISKPSYGYVKLYTLNELTERCRKGGLEVVRAKNTYKTVCVLCRKIDDRSVTKD